MEILTHILDINILAQASGLYELADKLLFEFAVFAGLLLIGGCILAAVLVSQGSYQAGVAILAAAFLIAGAPWLARFCMSFWQNFSLGG